MSTHVSKPLTVTTDAIREVVAQQKCLPADPATLTDESDLYTAGLTSLATVGLMLALEERFNVEFPERMLGRGTFRSLAAMAEAVSELVG